MLDHVFDVVDGREVDVHKAAVFAFIFGQFIPVHELDHVGEVVAGVKGDPSNIVEVGETGCDKAGTEFLRVDPVSFKAFEIEASVLKECHGGFIVHVFFEGKLEVELPSCRTGFKVVGIVGYVGYLCEVCWGRVAFIVEQADS